MLGSVLKSALRWLLIYGGDSLQNCAPDRFAGGQGWGNEAESLKWDLRPGVMVFMTQNADGSGRNFTLTGNGEAANLNDAGLKAQRSARLRSSSVNS